MAEMARLDETTLRWFCWPGVAVGQDARSDDGGHTILHHLPLLTTLPIILSLSLSPSLSLYHSPTLSIFHFSLALWFQLSLSSVLSPSFFDRVPLTLFGVLTVPHSFVISVCPFSLSQVLFVRNNHPLLQSRKLRLNRSDVDPSHACLPFIPSI